MREDTFRWLLLLVAVSVAGYLSGGRWQQSTRAAARERLLAQQALNNVKAEQKAAQEAYMKRHEQVFEAQARALDLQSDLRSLHEAEAQASKELNFPADAQVGRAHLVMPKHGVGEGMTGGEEKCTGLYTREKIDAERHMDGHVRRLLVPTASHSVSSMNLVVRLSHLPNI